MSYFSQRVADTGKCILSLSGLPANSDAQSVADWIARHTGIVVEKTDCAPRTDEGICSALVILSAAAVADCIQRGLVGTSAKVSASNSAQVRDRNRNKQRHQEQRSKIITNKNGIQRLVTLSGRNK